MKTVEGTEFDAEALKQSAAVYHAQGFNCAQSVACALAPEVGMDSAVASRAAEGFGAGMGGMSETCGAISGALIALGWTSGRGMDTPVNKKATYQLSRQVVDAFREKNGSTVCREIKGIGCDHPPLRSCPGCIDDAIDIAVGVFKSL